MNIYNKLYYIYGPDWKILCYMKSFTNIYVAVFSAKTPKMQFCVLISFSRAQLVHSYTVVPKVHIKWLPIFTDSDGSIESEKIASRETEWHAHTDDLDNNLDSTLFSSIVLVSIPYSCDITYTIRTL